MKFITLKENLKQGLSIVAHLTSKNINLPILNNILIRAKKEGIELIATNLEISVNHFLRGKIESEGEITVDSKIINEYISLLPEDKIEIEMEKDELKISCQNYKTKIKTQEASDFPVLPKTTEENCYELNLNEFRDSLLEVSFAVSYNENRPELSGVLFSFQNDLLTLVGTDSYRLSEKIIKFKSNNIIDEKKIIVPLKTVQELTRVLGNFKSEDQISDSQNIKICLTENQIFFSFGSTNLVSRIIIGNYPDYKQIIPKNEKTKIEINKSVFVKAIKAAGIFSKTGINDISIAFKKGEITISSSSSQTGENKVSLEADVFGEEDEIFINFKYLLDGLNNIKSEQIILKIIDNNYPCIIIPREINNFLYLVMPIKQ
ncbi:MAG TPA: DNA polymerase III subunit beta [bacterium]|nr:DNA polymerase III subunit beta [bacterium]